ncbi:hypothetical protein [Gorillibacterium massiliense]|uniref:hypothetical protein n=1 Tax=Gorillibacterium massiliense TaxID=1280390 RepID=UPI0004B7FCFA|nr:hypothetical protein [Gorillibacterium massiliense]
MQARIISSDIPEIDWAASGKAEIIQNVFTLINTLQYEIAYDRTLGLKRDFVDMPEPVAVPYVIAQIFSIVDEREPRAKVKDVTYSGISDDGSLIFEVVIDV